MPTKYLSEFEKEFEMEDEDNSPGDSSSELDHDDENSAAYSYELNDESEQDDSEFELENDDSEDDFETDDEMEDDYDSESDDEWENDYATWARDTPFDRDREFETRLYRAIRSNADNELQTELELDNVLHEMEQDYFFSAAKNWLKKKAKKVGKFAIPGYGALKAVSALGRLNIRNLLKNKLLQTAAGFIPGAGPLVSNAMRVAGDVMNKTDAAKQQIQNLVQLGKGAYQNLAAYVPDAQNEMEVREASRAAWKKALSGVAQQGNFQTQSNAGSSTGIRTNRTKRVIQLPPKARIAVFSTKISINRRQQVIPIKPNSIVVIKQSRLIIWETK